MRIKIFTLILITLFIPAIAQAEEYEESQFSNTEEEIFKAKVVEIINETIKTDDQGAEYTQQDIKLKGLEKEWKDKEVIYYGISDLQGLNTRKYKVGDKVIIGTSQDSEGNFQYYIYDYVRSGSIYWFALLFALIIIAIGRFKGLRALLSLIISFLVIMKFIIPQIMNGASPIFISVTGSLIILLVIIYLTEGIKRKSHLAIASIIISLISTALISVIFTNFAKLTGLAQEETIFLISSGHSFINLKGLLLAAIIIGAVGVLDDVVISQIAAAEQIIKANPALSKREIFKRTYKVGQSHLGSMVNTLFLAYAGASLPLLLLFTLNEPPFLSFGDVINHEVIATEIVRTLAGSIGLALAIPVATYLGAYFLKPKTVKAPAETRK